MRWRIVAGLSFAAAIFCMYCSVSGLGDSPVRMGVSPSGVVDLGLCRAGTEREFVFQVTNESRDPLVITGVETSCGCTGSSVDARSLDPGETTNVRLTYSASELPGKFSVQALVYYRGADKGSEASVMKLAMAGFVVQDVAPDPREISFTEGVQGQATVRLRSLERQVPLKVLSVKSDRLFVEAIPVASKDSADAVDVRFLPNKYYHAAGRATLMIEVSPGLGDPIPVPVNIRRK